MKKISIGYKIVKSNFGIIHEISEGVGLSRTSVTKIFKTGNGKTENKEKILNFLENKNIIEKGKYTILDFFKI